jgi:hypothetical protein
VFPPDEHPIPVHGYQNVENVGAHFDQLAAQKGHEYNFIELSEVGGADGRAEEACPSVHTAVDWIEEENETVGAVEFGIQTHVLIE